MRPTGPVQSAAVAALPPTLAVSQFVSASTEGSSSRAETIPRCDGDGAGGGGGGGAKGLPLASGEAETRGGSDGTTLRGHGELQSRGSVEEKRVAGSSSGSTGNSNGEGVERERSGSSGERTAGLVQGGSRADQEKTTCSSLSNDKKEKEDKTCPPTCPSLSSRPLSAAESSDRTSSASSSSSARQTSHSSALRTAATAPSTSRRQKPITAADARHQLNQKKWWHHHPPQVPTNHSSPSSPPPASTSTPKPKPTSAMVVSSVASFSPLTKDAQETNTGTLTSERSTLAKARQTGLALSPQFWDLPLLAPILLPGAAVSASSSDSFGSFPGSAGEAKVGDSTAGQGGAILRRIDSLHAAQRNHGNTRTTDARVDSHISQGIHGRSDAPILTPLRDGDDEHRRTNQSFRSHDRRKHEILRDVTSVSALLASDFINVSLRSGLPTKWLLREVRRARRKTHFQSTFDHHPAAIPRPAAVTASSGLHVRWGTSDLNGLSGPLPSSSSKQRTLPLAKASSSASSSSSSKTGLRISTEIKRDVVITGLKNYGQTCFLNSILQALASSTPFVAYLNRIVELHEHRRDLGLHSLPYDMEGVTTSTNNDSGAFEGGRTDNDELTLSEALLRIILTLNGTSYHEQQHCYASSSSSSSSTSLFPNRGTKLKHHAVDPRDVLFRVGIKHAQFRTRSGGRAHVGTEQQDAHELLQALVGMIIVESGLTNANWFSSLMESSAAATATTVMGTDSIFNTGPSLGGDETSMYDDVGTAAGSTVLSDDMSGSWVGSDEDGESIGADSVLSLSSFLMRVDKEQKRLVREKEDSMLRESSSKDIDAHSDMSRKREDELCHASCNGGGDKPFVTYDVKKEHLDSLAVPTENLHINGHHHLSEESDKSFMNGVDEKKVEDYEVSPSNYGVDLEPKNGRSEVMSSRSQNGHSSVLNGSARGLTNGHTISRMSKYNKSLQPHPSSQVEYTTNIRPSGYEGSTSDSVPRSTVVRGGEIPIHANKVISALEEKSAQECHDQLSTSVQRMLKTLSPITPSPLTGWIGSTLQCCACDHIRPIQNAPFLDIPIVPTSISHYLTSSRGAGHCGRSLRQSPSSPLPACTVNQCLREFTCVERVQDVECRSCAIKSEMSELEEETIMLRGAIETVTSRQRRRSKGSARYGGEEVIDDDHDDAAALRKELNLLESKYAHLAAVDPDSDVEDEAKLSAPAVPEAGAESFIDAHDLTGDAANTKSRTKRGCANKCLLLTRLPSILCLHVQRRYYDPVTNRMAKTMQHIDFPEILDLSTHCAYGGGGTDRSSWAGSGTGGTTNASSPEGVGTGATTPRTQIPYKLMSIIEHRGNAYAGHYQTIRRVVPPASSTAANGKKPKEWALVSDENVTFLNWKDVRKCQAYMLFYEAM